MNYSQKLPAYTSRLCGWQLASPSRQFFPDIAYRFRLLYSLLLKLAPKQG